MQPKTMTAEDLTSALAQFLLKSRGALVMEKGDIMFDLAEAKYSVSGQPNCCLLHLWSSERHMVRRVLDFETGNDVMKLMVRRWGEDKPVKLEIRRLRDKRSESARKMVRIAYMRTFERALERRYPGYELLYFSTAPDLRRTLSPVYARGLLRKGQSAFAVLGVNCEESQSAIDGSLAFGVIWLDACRAASAGRYIVEGLKLFVKPESTELLRARMANLNSKAAKWHLFEFDEPEDSITRLDLSDLGNVSTRLMRRPEESAVRERFAESIERVMAIYPEADLAVLSPAEVGFRCHGLEFAKAQIVHDPLTLRGVQQLLFGLGSRQHVLTEASEAAFVRLAHSIAEVRHAEGPHDHMFWRLQPEHWLESVVLKNIAVLDGRLSPRTPYSQMQAFTASDRSMMDLLGITRDANLAVIELKVDEDLQLPFQGLDYWTRVRWHHKRGEFVQAGYFTDVHLSEEDPALFMVAPALHVHPETETLLRYLSPAIDWTLIGIGEKWREKVRPVFRKRSAKTQPASNAEDADKLLGKAS